MHLLALGAFWLFSTRAEAEDYLKSLNAPYGARRFLTACRLGRLVTCWMS